MPTGVYKRPPRPSVCLVKDCQKKPVAISFCSLHYQRNRFNGDAYTYKRPTTEERFWKFVNKTDSCWLWTGNVGSDGYARFQFSSKKLILAYRFSYEMSKGQIQKGLELDHLCAVRNCVRPDHLEAVTHLENMRRGSNAKKTHCKHGHSIDLKTSPENVFLINGKWRRCLTCRRINSKKSAKKTYYRKKMELNGTK